MRPLYSRIEFLLAPPALSALATLLLNDHFLKAAQPGFLTGKLSDLSGVFLFPVFLCATWTLLGLDLSRRVIWTAILAADVIFAAVKVWPWANRTYLALVDALGFHSSLVMDWTDLFALVMSVPAYFYLRRYLSSES